MVKYIGKTAFSPKEVMFGIETQGRFGENDGYFDGLRYFVAAPKKGLFVKRSQIKKVPYQVILISAFERPKTFENL